MTDLMLDQLLEAAIEPEPMDDGFVASVMDEVHAHEQRRWRMKLVRRPVVFGVAAAVLATSGAVAALVGTHAPSHNAAVATPRTATVTVSSAPPARSVGVLPPSASSVASPSSSATGPSGHAGFASVHAAFVVDPTTGLKLTTETFTNDFRTGKAQKVALTVLNTGSVPIAVSGLNSCGLQVTATPAAGNALSPVCASGGVSNTDVLLAPGGFYTANANITLPSAGNWGIVGQCTCAYSHPTQTNLTSKTNTGLGGLLGKQAPPALIAHPESPASGVSKLSTPAIGVDASR